MMRPVRFDRLPLSQCHRTGLWIRAGAGDVFHGAYVYSYLVDPAKSFDQHFGFARAASTYKIQHLGNEAGLPVLADIDALRRKFGDVA
jgi:sugar/nucleoside kinase (ribokinase family)